MKYIILSILLTSCLISANSQVTITYYGHSCFEFQFEGTRILVDPFTPEWFDYEIPMGKFDMGFSTHDAKDHTWFEGIMVDEIFYASGISSSFGLTGHTDSIVIESPISKTINNKPVSFSTVPAFHDEVQGAQNGVNGILCFDFDGLRIVHMGDIGHVLEEKQIKQIGKVDVLMVPVDSYYIIDIEKAREIVDQLSPSIVMPIHHKTDKSRNKADEKDLEQFKATFDCVNEVDESQLIITKETLPEIQCLYILKYTVKQ